MLSKLVDKCDGYVKRNLIAFMQKRLPDQIMIMDLILHTFHFRYLKSICWGTANVDHELRSNQRLQNTSLAYLNVENTRRTLDIHKVRWLEHLEESRDD